MERRGRVELEVLAVVHRPGRLQPVVDGQGEVSRVLVLDAVVVHRVGREGERALVQVADRARRIQDRYRLRLEVRGEHGLGVGGLALDRQLRSTAPGELEGLTAKGYCA